MKRVSLNSPKRKPGTNFVGRIQLLAWILIIMLFFVACTKTQKEYAEQQELDSSPVIDEQVEEETGFPSPASMEPKSEEVSYEIRAEYFQQKQNVLLLLSDGNLFTFDIDTGDIQQVTKSGRNIIDFALSPSAHRLAILYADPAVIADIEFEGSQSTYFGTELIVVDTDTGSILSQVRLNTEDPMPEQNEGTTWSQTRKGIVLYSFNPYDPTKVVYSVKDQPIYWDVDENTKIEIPRFSGFATNLMWSREYFVIKYSEWEGTSYRVFNVIGETVQQNELTKEKPFFVYQSGDEVLGFINDSTLVSVEITGSDFDGEYNGVVRLFSCESSSLVAEYEVNDPRALFISNRNLLTTIDIFSTEWPLITNLTRFSGRVLSQVVAPDSVQTLFDFKWIPNGIALFNNSFIFSNESNFVLASGFRKKNDGSYSRYLCIYDRDSASAQIIENVGYKQYSWLN